MKVKRGGEFEPGPAVEGPVLVDTPLFRVLEWVARRVASRLGDEAAVGDRRPHPRPSEAEGESGG